MNESFNPPYDADLPSADDLPSKEVANAIREILVNQISSSEPDLIKEVARFMGYSRIGTIVETAMTLGIQKAVERGFGYRKDGKPIRRT